MQGCFKRKKKLFMYEHSHNNKIKAYYLAQKKETLLDYN